MVQAQRTAFDGADKAIGPVVDPDLLPSDVIERAGQRIQSSPDLDAERQ
jgi:hypothetical protein